MHSLDEHKSVSVADALGFFQFLFNSPWKPLDVRSHALPRA